MTGDRPEPTGVNAAWSSGDVASAWQKGTAAREHALAQVNEVMFDLAGVSPGGRVLDLGAGTGDQTVLAARRVGPRGSVLATDISGPMLDLAREAVRAGGLDNVETRVMDAQCLELASGSFEAAIARFSLQFVPDVPLALGEVRRVLKPGGRFAAVVFSDLERNGFRATPQAIASRLAGRPFPEPGPGQWALNDPTVLANAFERASFRHVDVRAVPFVYPFASLTDALWNLREAQPPLMRLLDLLSDADRGAAWAEIERALATFDGPDGFAGPAEALVVVGAA
ncbi:MAG: class I SAM-dependent methyltransferase [Chloroflexi bacterium]|nr:class I SAM-dependent methyltransferase [Chloroflexota bacterium]